VRNPGPQTRQLLDPSAPGRLDPRHEESKLIIPTSYGSYENRVNQLWPDARWARVIRDECHLERSPGTKISREVQKDRNSDGKKHLPRSYKRDILQNATSQCPSELAARTSGESPPFQICCPCVEHGPSGQLELKGQARLMIIPEHAIPAWGNVVEKFIAATTLRKTMA